ncbi:MAG: hypothetical protein JWO36_4526 [Myxococcales bacterium]|nr:hypothetical protein [Myxococcales bacterium]
MRIAGNFALACMSTSLLVGCVASVDGDSGDTAGDVADETVDVPADEPDPTPIAAGNPDLHPTYFNAIEKRMLTLTNQARAQEKLGVLRASAALTQAAFDDATAMAASGTAKSSIATAGKFYVKMDDDPSTIDAGGRVFLRVFQDEDSYEASNMLYAPANRTIGFATVKANGHIYVAVRFGGDSKVALLSVGSGTIAQFGGFETQPTWPIAAPALVTQPGQWFHNKDAHIVSGVSGYAGSHKVLRISDAVDDQDTATQIARARPGVYYRADVFVRGGGNSGSQKIALSFLDASFKALKLANSATSVTVSTGAPVNWTEKMTADAQAPAGAVWVRVILGDTTPEEQGTFDYDNFRLLAY